MVEKIIAGFRSQAASVHSAAFLLGVFAFLSQILGLLRDRLLALFFGASRDLDIYYAAFRIPDFLFVTVASLVAMSVVIPFLIAAEEKGEKEGRRFVADIFSFFAVAIIVAALFACIFMPQLSEALFPGFSDMDKAKMVSLSRIILLSPILLGLSNLCASIAQAHRRFLSYALAPLLYNAGIIAGILLFYPLWGLKGIALGVVLGASMHLLSQLPSLKGIPSARIFPEVFKDLGGVFGRIKSVMAHSIPRTAALSASSVSVIALLSMGSMLLPGSIAVFSLAFNLQSVPLSIVGVSYSMAAFPLLAGLAKRGEWNLYVANIIEAAKPIIFWSLPASIGLIVLRAHIVRIVFGAGAFSWSDTRLTAACLALFALSLIFQGLSLLFIRALYAAGETRRALFSSLAGAATTVAAAYGFLVLSGNSPTLSYVIADLLRIGDLEGFLVIALPLGFAVGSLVQCATLLLSMKETGRVVRGVMKTLVHSLGASLILGVSAYAALSALTPVFGLSTAGGVLLALVSSGAAGLLAWVLTLLLLRNAELEDVVRTLKGRFWKDRPVVSDADPMV